MRVGAGPGVRPEAWLRWSAHPLGGVVCRGHARYPAFAPSSSELAVGFLVSLYLLVHNLCTSVHALGFQSLIVSLYFVA